MIWLPVSGRSEKLLCSHRPVVRPLPRKAERCGVDMEGLERAAAAAMERMEMDECCRIGEESGR